MLRQLFFVHRAARHIRRNASRFDVIDALIGTLPFSKKNLKFNGLLVARSTGLPRAYERFSHSSRQRWPDQPRGKLVGRFFYKCASRLLYRNCERSLQTCDLINLINDDEIKLLQDPPTVRAPFIVQPNGLSETEHTGLAETRQAPEIRFERKEISFIGAWGPRKGARDWPEIIRRIRSAIPEARFNFFGTGIDAQKLLNELQLPSANGVRVVPSFERGGLPSLLEPCAIGLFPSYIEGFPLAVVEQLASGIPVVAYDVPGARQILQPLRTELLVPEADIHAMADTVVKILRMNLSAYAALSDQCRSIAKQFRWKNISAETMEHYRAALLRV
jgi:glycosyltransferase involved in cell wall biosynthesis